MLMQALFSRGDGPIHMRIHKFDYVFERNEHGVAVCDVLSQEHVHMMEQMKTFKRYNPPQVEEESTQEEQFSFDIVPEKKTIKKDRGR